jgi:hypothetical protein
MIAADPVPHRSHMILLGGQSPQGYGADEVADIQRLPIWLASSVRARGYKESMSAPKAAAVRGPRSLARLAFYDNSNDVRSLYALHQAAKSWTGSDRRHLGVANKGVFLLVAALWETYCEDLLFESVSNLVQLAGHPSTLPPRLQRQIALDVKRDQHELSPWLLAGDGWRRLAVMGVNGLRDGLTFNTPKAHNIDGLFERHLGLASVTSTWGPYGDADPRDVLDDYMTRRGELAHRAVDMVVQKSDVSKFFQLASWLTTRMDEVIGEHLMAHVGVNPYEPQAH